MAYLRKIKKNDKVVGWQININYTDPKTGKRKRKTKVAKTKKEAEKVMANMITKYENGPMLNCDNLTLGDYLKDWLNDKKNEVEYRTYKEYYKLCHTHIIPAIGKLEIKKIKPYHIKKYLAEKRVNGRIRGSGGLSERTLNYHYTTLNNALKQAVKFEMIEKNPCAALKPPSPKKKTKEIVFLTFDEVKELLNFLDGSWLYPVTFLEVNSGLRRGEMAALQWPDINFKNQLIHIQRSVYRQTGEGLKFKKTKRAASMRVIDVSHDVIVMLKKHRKKQLEMKLFMEKYNPHNLVFPLENGNLLDPDIITKRYKRTIAKTDLKPHTFQDLRHTHASLLLSAGVPIKVIQERLGHSTIKTPMDIYAHLIPGMQKEAAQILAQKLK